MNLEAFWEEYAKWSEETFGSTSERGALGPVRHLKKEVQELLDHLEQKGEFDLEEASDCVFLLFDAVRRAGHTYNDLTEKCFWKLGKNKTRVWVRTAPGMPIEHLRGIND